MKHTSSFLILLFVFCTEIICAQNNKDIIYNRAFVVFEGCESNDNLERCFEINFHEFIAENINNSELKDSIFNLAKKDTITIYTRLSFDENGNIIKKFSNISSPIKRKSHNYNELLNRIPKVQPVLDQYNQPVASTTNKLFGFLLNRASKKVTPILGYTPPEIPFSIIENVPLYKGCNKSLSNKEKKECMSSKINELISKNFNIKIASKLGLSPGLVRIFVQFKVDAKGRVIDIIARAPHTALEEEAIRVINKIPKLKKPGFQRGKPVIVPYALPIVFRVK